MKRSTVILGLVAWCTAANVWGQALPAKEQFHLFLLVGQSNMAGRGVVEEQDRKPDKRVLMFTKEGEWAPAVDPMHWDKPVAGVGLGRTFAMKVAEARPGVTVGLIPCAVGGSPIDAWKPGVFYEPTKSYPWDDAMRRAKTGMPAGVLKGILWHQGESDSTDALAPGYEAKLHDLIARMRRELGAENVPFIVGQLGMFEGTPWKEPRKVVDRAHRELPKTVKLTAFVRAEGLKDKGDQVHFDAASYRELGKRYAAVYLGIGK
jgi:carbohydrate esterase-like sialic acid-specific acetylesterase